MQQFPVAVTVNDVQTESTSRSVTDEEVIPCHRYRIAEALVSWPIHVVVGRDVGSDVGDGVGVERTLCSVNQPNGAVVVTAVRKQRAADLPCAGHFATIDVTVGRVVAEHEFRVVSVRMNGPERMPEIGALVEVLRPGPEDSAVAHHGRRPLAEVCQ